MEKPFIKLRNNTMNIQTFTKIKTILIAEDYHIIDGIKNGNIIETTFRKDNEDVIIREVNHNDNI